MTVMSSLMARSIGLAPAATTDVVVDRDLTTTMPDGTVLLADRWRPRRAVHLPLVLLRSPYGRRQLGLIGRLMAERGYQVLIQSCRGTFGSGGTLLPFRHERSDGLATLEWIAGQAWFGGTTLTFGPSYLGLTQWAVAGEAPEHLKAMALDVTARRFRDAVVHPGGSFALETGATWLGLVTVQERGLARILASESRAPRRLARVAVALPLADADRVGLGRTIDFYQEWLNHERPGDPWWDEVDFSPDLSHVPPASLVGGWYDIFLPYQVADYVALRQAGRPARLTIGPWTHTSLAAGGAQIADAVDWFDEQLGRQAPTRTVGGVRLSVLNTERWVDLDSWPPPATRERWHLHRHGRLEPAGPGPGGPDRFRYDPADPTPSVGGPSLNWRTAGRRDQAGREARTDVLCYTSAVLTADVTVAGPLTVDLWLRSSRAHTDVVVRLCDVDLKGASTNISDGILRIEPDAVEQDADGILHLQVPMWPTAVAFGRGHRIRLQVSSGAHPLFARNPGTDERLGAATTLVAADQEVFCDPDHPSAIELPISTI